MGGVSFIIVFILMALSIVIAYRFAKDKRLSVSAKEFVKIKYDKNNGLFFAIYLPMDIVAQGKSETEALIELLGLIVITIDYAIKGGGTEALFSDKDSWLRSEIEFNKACADENY